MFVNTKSPNDAKKINEAFYLFLRFFFIYCYQINHGLVMITICCKTKTTKNRRFGLKH